MYSSKIVVRFQVDGTHYWKDCPIEEVKFLRDNHHHTFFFECTKSVSHDDRDIELIQFKRDLQQFLIHQFYDNEARCLVFGGMSCEMIAKKLCLEFNLDQCSVFEDNIVGAICEKDHVQVDCDIVFVCGMTASGKTTFVDNFFSDRKVIKVSDLVREITQQTDRVKLNDTKEIDGTLIKLIRSQIDGYLSQNQKVVVDGVRQVQILEELQQSFTFDNLVNCKYIWLEVPFDIRERRYNKRSKIYNEREVSLKQIDELNIHLGVNEVKKFIESRHQIIKYY